MPNPHAKHSICLTFDDGPDPDYTPRLLDILDRYNAKATFFVLGEAAEAHPELVQQVVSAGHAVGNHSYRHNHPWALSYDRAQREVSTASRVLKEITGSAPHWFRPPFGRLRTAMLRQAQSEKMATVLWSRSIIDWGIMGTKAGIARRLSRINPGEIVLLHDGKRTSNSPGYTCECLPEFLRSLAQQGLAAKSLDEVF